MTDARLVVAWLVLLHLLAEYVFRRERDRRAGAGSLDVVHLLVVGVCFAPAVVGFGLQGAAVLAVVVVAHIILDGLETTGAPSPVPPGTDPSRVDLSLGPAWTARAAGWTVVVQAAHMAVLLAAWRVALADAAPTQLVIDLARNVAGTSSLSDFHRAVLTAVVGAGAVIVDVPVAARFVGILLRPWGYPDREASARTPRSDGRLTPSGGDAPARSWRIRFGPITGSVEASPAPHAETSPAASAAAVGPPASVGRVIGIFERLLITILVLAQAEAAVALVVGVKTIARYRQLDDRAFAEYYLLGTLASVLIGVAVGLVARWALA